MKASFVFANYFNKLSLGRKNSIYWQMILEAVLLVLVKLVFCQNIFFSMIMSFPFTTTTLNFLLQTSSEGESPALIVLKIYVLPSFPHTYTHKRTHLRTHFFSAQMHQFKILDTFICSLNFANSYALELKEWKYIGIERLSPEGLLAKKRGVSFIYNLKESSAKCLYRMTMLSRRVMI